MKRKIASVVAMSLLGLQAFVGVANAAGTQECAYGSGLLQVVADSDQKGATNDVELHVEAGLIECDIDGSSGYGNQVNPPTFTSISQIAVMADGDVTLYLVNDATTDVLLSFSGKELQISAGGTFSVIADRKSPGFNAGTKSVSMTVSDSALSVAGSSGELAGAGLVAFVGNSGADTFDASKLTGVPVDADGLGGKDVLKGGDDDDTLTGNSDGTDVADSLYGGEGDDLLEAGSGTKDAVHPGDGADTITGSPLTIGYADSSTAVEFDLTLNTVTDGDGLEDTFTTDAVVWIGSTRGDTFWGSGADNVFYGLGGADVARGYAGDDTFFGGDGNDKLVGNAGSDTLRGGAGDDRLFGRPGDDTLRGDKGSDEAWGGNGGDLCGAEVTDHCEFLA